MNKTLLLIATLLTAFLSCRKTDQKAPETLIEEARNYFETKVLTSKAPATESGRMKFRPDRKVKWEKASLQQLFGEDAVVVPLSMPGLKVTRDHGKIKLNADRNAFLVYRRNEAGTETAEIYIKVADEYSSEKTFSGTVVVADWNGTPLKAYEYKNRLMRVMVPTISTTQRAPSTESLFDDCDLIDWYYCVQYGSYPEECFYDYTEMQCYSWPGEPTGSNPGGWTYPPPGGTPGTITGGNNTYPIAKLNLLIKFDTSINASQASPCVRAVLNQLRDLPNGNGFWGKALYDVFGTIPNFKWTIKMGTLAANKAATTNILPPYTAGLAETTINVSYANTATDVSMAETLLHELSHAFLGVYWRQLQPNAIMTFPQMYQEYLATHWNDDYVSHEEMNRSFVEHNAYNLQGYGAARGYNMSNQFYIDMVLGGLQGTTYFGNLDALTQERIKGLRQAEFINQIVLTPSGIYIEPTGVLVCPL
jgi:hypothetical protein